MVRPPDVTLDDLAAPVFALHVQEVLDSVAPMAADLRFDPPELLALAVEAEGTDDVGDRRFEEPLGVLCDALTTEVELSPMGVVSHHTLLVQLLRNRLRVQRELVRHPEIREIEIARPIIIAGLPRTGTTHLHNLMSSDPALRSLPYWESLEPVPADEERGIEPDPRRQRCELSLGFMNEAIPYMKRMHEMTTDRVHEEIQLLAMDFSTMLFESMVPLPSYRDWWTGSDQTASYEYLKDVLRVLLHERGGTRWVLKSPQHMAQFPVLAEVFPDATFVITHRDPVAITASVVAMVAYASRFNLARPDPVAMGAYWRDRVEDLLRACVRDHDALPEAQTIDVGFDDFMADDLAMVERIYTLADQPWDDGVQAVLQAYLDDHPRGRHGGVRYDLGALGLDGAERGQALAFYRDRFGV
jgi:Sulfotransferase family